MFQPEDALEAARFVDHRQAGTLLDQQEHWVGRVRPANADPLCGAADLDCLERIDGYHGYALATFGAWPVAWARRAAAPGS